MRSNIASRLFSSHDDTGGIRATISIGIAARTHETSTAIEMLRHADQALYRAKAQGGNAVIVTDELASYTLGVQASK
jgi:diguanylate cyclase (GGDEF)-like protein